MTVDKEEAAKCFRSRPYSPYADRAYPTKALWGDTHRHTANSPDAFPFTALIGHEWTSLIKGNNLHRVVIFRDDSGELHEQVYDVAWAGNRKPGANGKLPPIGNTVDVKNATFTNTIGAPELITVWKDPRFDPSQRAFYYARVIEIPTPRWTAYDAKRFGIEMDPEVPMSTIERAYTSAIWYTPSK